jgi:hypothetical protein
MFQETFIGQLADLWHSRRAFLQIQIWTASHVAKPHIPSILEYGLQRGKDSLQPVYLKGPMSATERVNSFCIL